MPPEAQVSLLRLLQNHETSRLGGKSSRRIDVRVLAATNRNLPQAIKEGKFREDLYYRLNVMVISVPPCGNGRKTSRLWRNIFSEKPESPEKQLKTFRPKRGGFCGIMRGPAMRVSWKMWWNARSISPRPRSSRLRTFLPSWNTTRRRPLPPVRVGRCRRPP